MLICKLSENGEKVLGARPVVMFLIAVRRQEIHILALQLLCLSPFQSERSGNRVMVEKVATAAEPLSQTIACI